MLRAIDTHAHLDHVEDVEKALKEAHQAGVVGVVAVGTDLKANMKNLEIKNKTQYPKIFVALGIHPESLEYSSPEEVEEDIQFIHKNTKEAVAIGEIGLDYWYKWARKNEDKKRQQREVFSRQLSMAQTFNLPVIVHSRGSWRDCLDMTKSAHVKAAVFHWYSGPLDILDEILSCGYCISASPALSYSPPHQAAVKHAPIENVLIETDSPVFYGEGENGFRATPKDVFRTLKLYADLKMIDQEKAAEAFYRNSLNLFGIS